ncbi:Rdx family protein [Candidatus Neomarinimicrobiota bacterium]
MADKVKQKYGTKISEFNLIESDGGVYEFSIDGALKFSKKTSGRFPEDGEIYKLIDSA